MKNYNEAMLESMSNGVITLDENERVATCNAAGLRILRLHPEQILHKPAAEFFSGSNAWVHEKLKRVGETQTTELAMEAELMVGEDKLSVNLTALPLLSMEKKRLGSMLMLEDISNEKRMRSTMSRLMDPGIADQMLAGGADALGGKNVMATVLFSDIRGFTTITEQLGAQGTVALLNEYFTLMVDCIQREEGMLDKFIGDAIMAAFGIPVGHDDDADRSVRTSIAMIRELWSWNKLRLKEGKLPVDIGIGLNTDNVVSGTIGSKKRMDYTIIGDGVNLAARLESACKQYGAHILISEFTYKQLRGTYYSRELDLVVVKGKTQPVAIYEILDYHTEESYPQMSDALRAFKAGLQKYRQQKWSDAKGEFNDVLAFNPEDKAAKMYISRCDHFIDHPPGGEWDGVWVMESK
jgi:adenylate cyclase